MDTRKAQLQAPRIGGWIRMHVDSSGHSVLGVIPVEPQPARFPRAAEEPELETLVSDIEARYPEIEIEIHAGGQPHYPLLLSAE